MLSDTSRSLPRHNATTSRCTTHSKSTCTVATNPGQRLWSSREYPKMTATQIPNQRSGDDGRTAMTTPPVFLLKTPSTPKDMYEEYFRKHTFPIKRAHSTSKEDDSDNYKYDPIFVPVLSHRFQAQNLEIVKSYFSTTTTTTTEDNVQGEPRNNAFTGPGRKYGGIIFTSQRAVEALGHILSQGGEEDIATSTSTSKDMVLYSVGPATTRTLTPIRDKYLPFATIYGDEAGDGETLAHLILEHYNERHHLATSGAAAETAAQKPGLLFLVGEQRRDIIPKTLMSKEHLDDHQRIHVDELVVYETSEMSGFEAAFREEVQKGESLLKKAASKQQKMWTVIFSPTGCDAVLRTLDIIPPTKNTDANARNCLIATIGPTTRDYLLKNYGFKPDVVARKPTPMGVGEGIREYLLGNGIA